MKLTTQECRDLLKNLNALNGWLRTVTGPEGKENVVQEPFKLSGDVIIAVSENVWLLEPIEKKFDAARLALITNLAKGGDAIDEDDPDQKKVWEETIEKLLA